MAKLTLGEIKASLEKAGWYVGREIGSGGGAKVFLCLSKPLIESLEYFMGQSGSVIKQQDPKLTCLSTFDTMYHSSLSGSKDVAAVKIPFSEGSERLKREIAALKVIQHPNLIKLYDAENIESPRWFVMEYHSNGTLQHDCQIYNGRPLQAIKAVQGIAESLSLLHRHATRYVHRDIKPKNIFIDSQRRLVLGDFGIAFPNEDDGDRLTIPGTSEIFSRDWVPDWVRFRELDKYGPKMDVYMLAKVIYFMVSGGRNVQASQLSDQDFDLAKQFPQSDGIGKLYRFLKRCITTHETACEPNDGRELEVALNELVDEITYRPRAQSLFALFQPHSTPHIPIPMTGGMGPREIITTQVFIGRGQSRFTARARVRRETEQNIVSMRFKLGGASSNTIQIAGSDLGSDDWSHEMTYAPKEPLTEEWYKLSVEATGTQTGAALVAINIYGQ